MTELDGGPRGRSASRSRAATRAGGAGADRRRDPGGDPARAAHRRDPRGSGRAGDPPLPRVRRRRAHGGCRRRGRVGDHRRRRRRALPGRLRPRPGERRARARGRAAGDAEPRRRRLPAPGDRQRRPGDALPQRPSRLSGDELFAIEMASFLRIPGAEGETAAERALDPSAVDATRIAAVVRDAPDDALRRGMGGPIRELILDEIFRRFPEYFKRGPGRSGRRDRVQDHRPRRRRRRPLPGADPRRRGERRPRPRRRSPGDDRDRRRRAS